jgi:acyl CoA:acetate/3-ketoacid CoA transferase alpha subunit
MLQRIWKLPAAERLSRDVSSLEFVMTGSAPCPPWVMRAFIEWLGPEKLHEAFGPSERIGGTHITGREWLEHPGSVGRPTGGRRVRIVGEDGRTLAPGEVGDVFFLPPGGQGSTYRYVGATARATGDGWETLGDVGYLDREGFLYLVDRRTDMIVTGGENVYPAEVEGVLDAHPGVGSSCVIGLPDEDLGQRLHAIVQAPLIESSPRISPLDRPLQDPAASVVRAAARTAQASCSLLERAERGRRRTSRSDDGEGIHERLAPDRSRPDRTGPRTARRQTHAARRRDPALRPARDVPQSREPPGAPGRRPARADPAVPRQGAALHLRLVVALSIPPAAGRGCLERAIVSYAGEGYPTPVKPVVARALRVGSCRSSTDDVDLSQRLFAGAQGVPFTTTRSLIGSDMAGELEAQGVYREIEDPFEPGRRQAVIRALRPDLSFVHAWAADPAGNAICFPPTRRRLRRPRGPPGVILTVDRIIDTPSSPVYLVRVPADRVLDLGPLRLSSLRQLRSGCPRAPRLRERLPPHA